MSSDRRVDPSAASAAGTWAAQAWHEALERLLREVVSRTPHGLGVLYRQRGPREDSIVFRCKPAVTGWPLVAALRTYFTNERFEALYRHPAEIYARVEDAGCDVAAFDGSARLPPPIRECAFVRVRDAAGHQAVLVFIGPTVATCRALDPFSLRDLRPGTGPG